MKDEKKKERLAALFGIELPKEPDPPTVDDQLASRSADATLIYYETPEYFRQIECKRCSHLFAVNMASVAYCSDECRKKSLADIGIEWDPTKPQEERWGNHIPLVVPPQALTLIAELKPEVPEEDEAAQSL